MKRPLAKCRAGDWPVVVVVAAVVAVCSDR